MSRHDIESKIAAVKIAVEWDRTVNTHLIPSPGESDSREIPKKAGL